MQLLPLIQNGDQTFQIGLLDSQAIRLLNYLNQRAINQKTDDGQFAFVHLLIDCPQLFLPVVSECSGSDIAKIDSWDHLLEAMIGGKPLLTAFDQSNDCTINSQVRVDSLSAKDIEQSMQDFWQVLLIHSENIVGRPTGPIRDLFFSMLETTTVLNDTNQQDQGSEDNGLANRLACRKSIERMFDGHGELLEQFLIAMLHHVNGADFAVRKLSDGWLDQTEFQNLLNGARRLHELEIQFHEELENTKFELAKQLAYGASHEINNPLGNIASRAQMISTKTTDGSLKHQLSTIYHQSMRAHEMITDMMFYARPSNPVFERIDLRTVIERSISDLIERVSDLQIESVPNEELEHFIDADENLVAELFRAIILNSIESEPDCKIRIHLDRFESWTNIRVMDSGPGLTTETAWHMFDPFYSGREAGRGLGFGLAKSKRIVELHRGSIRWVFESEEQSGPMPSRPAERHHQQAKKGHIEIRLPNLQPHAS